MPRAERLEYEGAFYHVMNRGRGRQTIFHDERYFKAFVQVLEEANKRFDAVVHCYCLMSNHYHLLIETPRANISRIMRHINGVYTQRYNRLRKTDGPLFRGRFKSILVDSDAYLLQLTRYIHRNPIEVSRQFTQLSDYKWSSYRAYINLDASPDWLTREKAYQMLGMRNKYKGYQSFVAAGIDDEIKQFYSKGNVASVLGDRQFREEVQGREKEPVSEWADVLREKPAMEAICRAVAKVSKVDLKSIVDGHNSRLRKNQPRKLAMYLCQMLSDEKLANIAEYFGLQSVGSVCPAISEMKKLEEKGEMGKALNQVYRILNIKK